MVKASKRVALAAALAAVVASTVGTAKAESWITFEQRNYGQWDYSATVNSESGEIACDISTHWPDGREVRLIAFSQPRVLALAVRDSRNVGTRRGTGTIEIDGREFSAHFDGDGRGVAIARIDKPEAAGRFLAAFAMGDLMHVALPSGQRLIAGLRGSSPALAAMNGCVGKM